MEVIIMKTIFKRQVILPVVLLLPLLSPVLVAQDKNKKELEREYEKHSRRAAPQDRFPVFHNPEKVSVKKADEFMKPNEWVIGVTINDESAAYPVQIMGVHELGNDKVGGKPITVCW